MRGTRDVLAREVLLPQGKASHTGWLPSLLLVVVLCGCRGWIRNGQAETKGYFLPGIFRKRVGVPIGVPGGGVWGRVQVGGGGGFPLENEGQGKGGGWGGEGWQVNAHVFVKTTLPTKSYAANCKLFWESLRCAVRILGSETIIFLMQLHLPYFPGTPSNVHLQLSR